MDFLDIEDFEGFIWADTLEEAEARWDITAKKQVFILDDFWGSVFHRDSRRKEAEKLENFITRVRENENKRLIITTREYIIRQEMDMSPGLRDVIENFKMECVLKDMSAMEKAKILFRISKIPIWNTNTCSPYFIIVRKSSDIRDTAFV